jgi:hypothetical protein
MLGGEEQEKKWLKCCWEEKGMATGILVLFTAMVVGSNASY